MHPKDIALAPIYFAQAYKLKRWSPSLPEPEGERHGTIRLNPIYPPHEHSEQHKERLGDNTGLAPLSIMMVGDSSAAGVGVKQQKEALLGQLIDKLQSSPSIIHSFSAIEWYIHATTGHTSFDILRRLYVLPAPSRPTDVAIVMAGVNDITANTSSETWQRHLGLIIELLQRKFKAKHIIFASLPPMAHMPAIPRPLSSFLGSRADKCNQELAAVCENYDGVTTFGVDFSILQLSAKQLFSKDGFHPNSIAYEHWAKLLSKFIIAML